MLTNFPIKYLFESPSSWPSNNPPTLPSEIRSVESSEKPKSMPSVLKYPYSALTYYTTSKTLVLTKKSYRYIQGTLMQNVKKSISCVEFPLKRLRWRCKKKHIRRFCPQKCGVCQTKTPSLMPSKMSVMSPSDNQGVVPSAKISFQISFLCAKSTANLKSVNFVLQFTSQF